MRESFSLENSVSLNSPFRHCYINPESIAMDPRGHFESPPREFSRVNSSREGGSIPSLRVACPRRRKISRGGGNPSTVRAAWKRNRGEAEKGGREEEGLPRGAGTRERVACINKSAVRAAGGGESRVILVHVQIVRGERVVLLPLLEN